jgi:hypothetical protein
VVLAAVCVLVGMAVSGGSSVDPPVPQGFPGPLPAFLVRDGSEGDAGTAFGREREVRAAVRRDRRWLSRARPLGDAARSRMGRLSALSGPAPAWAVRLYRRSLLVLRASVDRNGAAVAGARAGWAYVWPRDAGTIALALAAAGYRAEARRIARFLLELDLDAAARFDRSGEPVEGRATQGDAGGWVAVAARAAQLSARPARHDWRDRADYQEGDPGAYLANALALTASGVPFASQGHIKHTGRAEGDLRGFISGPGLVRIAGDPESGLDTTAAWAVRPFPRPELFPAARRTLHRLVAERKSRFGLLPSEHWHGGEDPWTAPTTWVTWALAALSRDAAAHGHVTVAARDRRAALSLVADLRRAATPAGLLPERVDAETGAPASTTPLAWSHAFAILALRELWPARASS